MSTIKYHTNLACYFTGKPLYLDEPTQKKPNTRKLVEQPWQQTKGEMWDEVTDTLCKLDFIQAKAAAKMTYELVNDLNATLEVIPENAETIREEKVRQARMDKYTQDLIACAKGEITIEEREIPECITPWTKEQTESEIESTKNYQTKADNLRDFINFLGIEASNLQNYSHELQHLATQQAWNYVINGAVGAAAENRSPEIYNSLLLRYKDTRPFRDPKPQVYKILQSHNAEIYAVAITPDGKLAISASGDKTCILWSLKTGMQIHTLRGHTGMVKGVAITPDGRYAISCSVDQTCIFWDLITGLQIHTLRGHTAQVTAVAITPDGSRAISSSKGCILWDLETGNPIREYEGSGKTISSVAIAPGGKHAIAGSYDHTCVLWNLDTAQQLHKLVGHSSLVESIDITPCLTKAISGSWDGDCILWDLKKGQPIYTLKGHIHQVYAVAITADGKRALSGSLDGTCIFWDLITGKAIQTLKEHSDSILAVALTPDGATAISGSYDKSCIHWNLLSGQQIQKSELHSFRIGHTSISYDGKRALSTSENNTCVLWNLENRQQLIKFKGHSDTVSSIAMTPDGNRAISGSMDKTCIIWDLKTGQPIQTLRGHTENVNKIAISVDGTRAISCGWDKICILWDLITGRQVYVLSGFFDKIQTIAITPDGKHAIICESIIQIIWDLDTGKVVQKIKHNRYLDDLLVTADGKHAIISAIYDKKCEIWKIKSGKQIQILKEYTSEINTFSITTDGKWIISGLADNSCVLRNLKTGQQVAKYMTNSSIRSIQFFPKGILIVCLSGECIVINHYNNSFYPSEGIVTVKQIWDFDKKRLTEPLVYCSLCGHRFEPSKVIVKIILEILHKNNIQPEQSPCHELPDETWEHSGLLGECPSCHEPLKFNPFFGSDQKGIEEYLLELEKDREWETVFENAEKAFKEQIWEEAFKLYLKLISAEKFDASYMRYNMAICRINGLIENNQEIIANINLLIRLLEEKHENEKAQSITEKLKERLDLIKEAEKPWWKKLF